MRFVKMFVIAFVILFSCAFQVYAEDFKDAPEEGDISSLASYSASGPYLISNLERTSSTAMKVYFTSGSTYTTSIPSRQNAVGGAIVTNSYVYLYLNGSYVEGILVLTD